MTLSELERLAREAQDIDEALRIARTWTGDLHPQFRDADEAKLARALLKMDERCRAMERVVEAARGIDARIGFSGGRAGVRFIEPAGIQRRELLDALLALDALGKEGA